jgi:hypothetical protein
MTILKNIIVLAFLFGASSAQATALIKYAGSNIMIPIERTEISILSDAQPSSVLLTIFFAGTSVNSLGMNLGGYADVKVLQKDMTDSKSNLLIEVTKGKNGFSISSQN